VVSSGLTSMNEVGPLLNVLKCKSPNQRTKALDVFVLAMGFEERAFSTLSDGIFQQDAKCILIRYKNDIAGNKAIFERYHAEAEKKFSKTNIETIDLITDNLDEFISNFTLCISSKDDKSKHFGVDISGMTSYAICIVLKIIRELRPFQKQTVFYTSAKEYVPTRAEYDDLREKLGVEGPGEEIDYLPKSMALEMSENLVLDAFAGHRSGEGRACLALFAGYEVHRSSGTIESTNPSLLLLLYGDPGDAELGWRLELSKSLHARFEKGRRCATEIVSTLHVQQSIDALESYYNYLIDDHDLIIAPVCSKMHTVAAYLFWERYGEVQLIFPLPIGYNPEHRPRGVGCTYYVELYEPRMFFREKVAVEPLSLNSTV
jgi:hypothetical protein